MRVLCGEQYYINEYYTEREGPLKYCQKSPQKKTKKKQKKKREREDVFDVLPERGREARLYAQGAPPLLPRVCLFLSFFRRWGRRVALFVVGPEEDCVGFFFGLEFFDIILSLF